MIWVFDFKEESIWTEFFFGLVVDTLVVFVTLFWIREESVVLGALEGGLRQGNEGEEQESEHVDGEDFGEELTLPVSSNC